MSFAAVEARGGRVVEARAGERVTWTVTLPRPTRVQLVFTRESVANVLGKLLWPEIQLGDPAFDDVVVARTTTEEATRAFLHDPEARAFAATVVAGGGELRIDGATLEVEVPSWAPVGARDVAAFVERLI